jgi:hypothetical protein
MNDLWNMPLHEQCYPTRNIVVLRVPGGWIYYHYGYDMGHVVSVTSTFVPLHNEFMEKE